MSENGILDPEDDSLSQYTQDVDLQHNIVDTTHLSIEESAIRVLDVVTGPHRPRYRVPGSTPVVSSSEPELQR
jgi:hypothetical protein